MPECTLANGLPNLIKSRHAFASIASARLLRLQQKHETTICIMDLAEALRTAEIHIGDFLLPWGMVISTFGFIAAWLIILVLERLCLTRHIWNLPLFFVSLAVLIGCLFGIAFTP